MKSGPPPLQLACWSTPPAVDPVNVPLPALPRSSSVQLKSVPPSPSPSPSLGSSLHSTLGMSQLVSSVNTQSRKVEAPAQSTAKPSPIVVVSAVPPSNPSFWQKRDTSAALRSQSSRLEPIGDAKSMTGVVPDSRGLPPWKQMRSVVPCRMPPRHTSVLAQVPAAHVQKKSFSPLSPPTARQLSAPHEFAHSPQLSLLSRSVQRLPQMPLPF